MYANNYNYYQQPFNTVGGYGYQYQPYNSLNQPNFRTMSTLTPEEHKLLNQGSSQGFTINLTDQEVIKAISNHRDPQTGELRLIQVNEPDGSTAYISQITGEKIRLFEGTEEEADQIIDDAKALLETIKVIYLDANPELVRTYFPVLGLLEKAKPLYKIASKNYSKHNAVFSGNNRQNTGNIGMIDSILNNSFRVPGNIFDNQMSYGYQNNPFMGQQQQPYMGQPMMQQQQQMAAPQMGVGLGQQPQFNYQYQQPMMQQQPVGVPQQPMGQPVGQPMMQQPTQPLQPAPYAFAYHKPGAASTTTTATPAPAAEADKSSDKGKK